ncbi:hypothetical protein FFWV33_12530 [Flavobacterium faecale]|uniref:Tox-MPTase2 domain-containing protein n=1 Tax=Flavobacterium faecale TaxID=1355330 RepID=A0A2S1LEV4_9FLAO|nr:hypothetical protein FFWV33_12530 [Flavobacterium faecale]
MPGNSLNYQIGDVITFNGPFYFSDLDKVRKNLFTETGTAAANLVNPEILQHGNYYEIKSLSYTWTAVSTKFNGGYIGGFEGKECPDKTSTTPPGFPTNTGTDYENTGAFNDIPDDEEDSQTQGNTPPDDCYQPCTTSKLTTSKIVVTKGEQKMCSCEENLAESDFVDIVNLIDLTPPDFRIEGNTVKIKSEDGTYKKPSELDPNSHFDGIELNRYAASLARELNDKNNFFYIGSRKATDPSSENQASTLSSVKFSDGTKGSVITLNSNGGYSKDLDNVNNFKSILKHEIFHVDDNILKTPDNLSTHIDVYINAMKHITFKDATRDYQIGTIRSLVRYILNMDKRTDTQRDYPVYEIKQKIDNFNNIAGLDFTFVIDPLDYNQKGTLDIKIRDRQNFNSLLPQIPYKIISDEN